MLNAAMYGAVRQYSFYQPTQKRWGTASLLSSIPTGTAIIQTTGIQISAGQQFTLGYGLPTAETVTVASATPPQFSQGIGMPQAVTLTAVTNYPHSASEIIYPTAIGLSVQPNIDQYIMPSDFLEPEMDTFQLAIGSRVSYRNQSSFYGQLYSNAEKFSAVGIGDRLNFGGYGGVSMVLMGGPTPLPVSSQNVVPYYSFRNNVPIVMTIWPAPQYPVILDFWYYAICQPSDVPDDMMDAVLDYAMFIVLTDMAAQMGSASSDFKDSDVEETPSQSSYRLSQIADKHKDRFDVRVRKRPYAISG